ncbi:hypothetical protein CVT25_011544 [Psilocybe cyanescens]|uniref:Prolyl 4-hydroxylase alpha subunit Fe(2+) 2OG dioxygenase domain-containing protein n=1 Tax=Psilocybe cyanescens TaxID=93625 RepID=A0A409XCA2_PSICY|nr:hypothetical protein CVT25_011544 [Psilocybe cyanescens]
MNLKNQGENKDVVNELNSMSCFQRIAGFGSAVMKHRAPALYAHYVEKLGKLYRENPELKRPFLSSVFSAVTYNLGPHTACYRHRDSSNLPFGWCAVTSLGSFDYKKGGHLILWDCRLVIEFPPGATILLPSAVVVHSNVSISSEERRYSFVQYSAGALFRWVENNNQKAVDYYATLSSNQRDEQEQKNSERWKLGLSLLPVVDLPISHNVDVLSSVM